MESLTNFLKFLSMLQIKWPSPHSSPCGMNKKEKRKWPSPSITLPQIKRTKTNIVDKYVCLCLGTKGTPSDFSNSHKLFFPLVYPKNDEKQYFFQSWTNLNGQIWPSITKSSQLFFEKFFLHMTHMHGFYLSPIVLWKMKTNILV